MYGERERERGRLRGGMEGGMEGWNFMEWEEKEPEEKKRRSGKQWRNEEKGVRRERKKPVTHLNEEPFLDSKHRTPTRPRQCSTSLARLIFGDLGCTRRVQGPVSRRGLRVWGKEDRGLRRAREGYRGGTGLARSLRGLLHGPKKRLRCG